MTYSPCVVFLRGPGQSPVYSSPHDAMSIFSSRFAKPLSSPHHFCFSPSPPGPFPSALDPDFLV